MAFTTETKKLPTRPPVRKSTTCPDSQLLWIEVSNNTAGKTQTDSTSKRGHVLREYYRKARLTSEDFTRSPTIPSGQQTSFQPVPDLKASKTKFRLEIHCSRKNQTSRKPKCITMKQSTTKAHSSELVVSEVVKSAKENPLNISASEWDPFDSFGMGQDDGITSHMAHFQNFFCTAVCPLVPNNWFTWWMRHATDSAAVMGVVLSISASHQQLLHAASREDDLTVDAYRYKGNSLRLLNSSLAIADGPLTSSVFCAVAAHTCIESVMVNLPTAQAHLDGLSKIVELAGGMEHLDRRSHTMTLMASVKFAQATCTEPRFKMSESWKNDVVRYPELHQLEQNPPTVLEGMGDRFFEDDLISHFTPGFVDLLHKYRGVLYYQHRGLEDPTILQPTDDDLFLLFEHEFVEIGFYEEHIATTIQDVCREAILLYSDTRIRKCFVFRHVGVMLSTIKRLLPMVYESCIPNAPDFLLWVLYLGASSTTWQPQHAAWYTAQLRKAAKHMNIQSWAEMRNHLRGFFFVDRDFGFSFKNDQVWEIPKQLSRVASDEHECRTVVPPDLVCRRG